MIVALFAAAYAVMLHDTDSVIRDFKNCVADAPEAETIKDTALYEYYDRNDVFNNEIADATVRIRRNLVFHNFRKGVMFVNYDCDAYDSNGEPLYGSRNIDATWYIEKKNGIWEVVEVKEMP